MRLERGYGSVGKYGYSYSTAFVPCLGICSHWVRNDIAGISLNSPLRKVDMDSEFFFDREFQAKINKKDEALPRCKR